MIQQPWSGLELWLSRFYDVNLLFIENNYGLTSFSASKHSEAAAEEGHSMLSSHDHESEHDSKKTDGRSCIHTITVHKNSAGLECIIDRWKHRLDPILCLVKQPAPVVILWYFSNWNGSHIWFEWQTCRFLIGFKLKYKLDNVKTKVLENTYCIFSSISCSFNFSKQFSEDVNPFLASFVQIVQIK